jgi:hypothetical protein
MRDILVFLREKSDGEITKCVAYRDNDKIIMSEYNNQYECFLGMHFPDYKAEWTLLQHVEDFFSKPGLKNDKLIDHTYTRNEIGFCYPRIFCPGLDQVEWVVDREERFEYKNYNINVLNESVLSCRILLARLNKLFETISFDIRNFTTFGHEIRNFLLLGCMEVESSWNGILTANGHNGRKTTNDYVKLLQRLYLKDYEIKFVLYPDIISLKPFKDWEAANPTTSLFWYDAYNKTKHDRETNMHLASFENAINSIAAVLIMLYAQFGPTPNFWKTPDFLGIEIVPPVFNIEDYYIPDKDYRHAGIYPWKQKQYAF